MRLAEATSVRGRISGQRIYLLPLQQIQPVIHLAHRVKSRLWIEERVIFDHELVLTLQGKGEVLFRSERISFGPHSLLFIPPFVPHAFECSRSARHEHLAIHFDFSPKIPRLGKKLDERTPYTVRFSQGLEIPRISPVNPADSIEVFFLKLVTLWNEPTEPAKLSAHALLFHILSILIRTASKSSAPVSAGVTANRKKIDRVTEEMERCFSGSLPVTRLAAVAGFSPSHFNRLFREWLGYSPLEYLRRLRIEKAKQFLGNIDLSIKQIALLTGFADPYHFSKAFHQIVGLPPSLYRQTVLESQTPGK